MDRILARKLEDKDFEQKILKLGKDYLELGKHQLDYYAPEFDVANDLLQGYAALTKGDLDNLDRGHPKRFILPVVSTQITTMATFIAQMLFGDAQPHKVEGRGPEDETSAVHVNQLLRWNDEQQPDYLLGYLWIQDALNYNRGIRYNCWAPICQTRTEAVEVVDEETGETVVRPKKVKEVIAGFNRVHLVSPYDFFCDPSLPLWRFQEGRFSGHRTTIPWQELKKRSLLPPDDPAYVLPSAVETLRVKKRGNRQETGTAVPGTATNTTGMITGSRTAFERNRRIATPGQMADKNDPGNVDCHELFIRLVPSDNGLYEGDEPVIFQVLLGNLTVVLSINEMPNKHDEYPYAVAEGRPNAYYQHSPGWTLMLKPLQDYIDYLKDKRQRNVARTGGNMFIVRSDMVNVNDFTNPDKDGLLIPVNPGNDGTKLDDIARQVQVNDTSRDFHQEMKEFVEFSQTVSGVSSQMQGTVEGDATATEYTGATQMGAGRLSSTARLISVQALVPETRQFVSNFQQFLNVSMSLRFVPGGFDSPNNFQGSKVLQISSDTIQGRFDYIAHDGSLPGTDTRKVAAISRLLELVPLVPQIFVPAPGNIDPRALVLSGAKAAGLNVENYQFSQDTPMPSPADMAAASGEAPPSGVPPEPPGPGLLPDLAALGGGRGPGQPPTPTMTEVPSAAPLQIRPNQL